MIKTYLYCQDDRRREALVTAGLIAGGASLLGGLLGHHSSNHNTKMAIQANKEAIDQQAQRNLELAKYQNDAQVEFWKQQEDYNSPANQLKRYRDAGLHTGLLYGQVNNTPIQGGTLSAPQGVDSGAQAISQAYAANTQGQQFAIGQMTNAINQVMQTRLLQAQVTKSEAEADKAAAEASYTTFKEGFERWTKNKQFEHLDAMIEQLKADTRNKNRSTQYIDEKLAQDEQTQAALREYYLQYRDLLVRQELFTDKQMERYDEIIDNELASGRATRALQNFQGLLYKAQAKYTTTLNRIEEFYGADMRTATIRLMDMQAAGQQVLNDKGELDKKLLMQVLGVNERELHMKYGNKVNYVITYVGNFIKQMSPLISAGAITSAAEIHAGAKK